MEVSLEEIPDEGLLVSWAFTDRPDLSLMVLPKQQTREVRRGRQTRDWTSSGAEHRLHLFSSPQRDEEETDLSTVEELIKDAIISTQPAMMINLRACSAPGGLVSEHPKGKICPYPISRVLYQDYCSFYLLLLLGSQ